MENDCILPRRRSDVSVIDYGQQTVLYDAQKNKVHALNSTAMRIWRYCDDVTT